MFHGCATTSTSFKKGRRISSVEEPKIPKTFSNFLGLNKGNREQELNDDALSSEELKNAIMLKHDASLFLSTGMKSNALEDFIKNLRKQKREFKEQTDEQIALEILTYEFIPTR